MRKSSQNSEKNNFLYFPVVYNIKGINFAVASELLTYGVIGNTSDFGSDILGSSPSRSTQKALEM